jgi:hypothetical protein
MENHKKIVLVTGFPPIHLMEITAETLKDQLGYDIVNVTEFRGEYAPGDSKNGYDDDGSEGDVDWREKSISRFTDSVFEAINQCETGNVIVICPIMDMDDSLGGYLHLLETLAHSTSTMYVLKNQEFEYRYNSIGKFTDYIRERYPMITIVTEID